MALAAGARLGPYEILSALGAGGMGEVYRARDTKLDREVAIKVLPDLFVSDPERVARFQREARTLAALNHPHIGGIYGLEDADGVRALVLELVEGPTLADRIAQGPIPLDEALPIARQIAEALEAAHEQGIMHRDLKPANIKLRRDGTVKVLDFGLAKALQPVGGTPPIVSQSPTITSPAMTRMGVILGTAAYMSPEQARGQPVDKRADIWAFGCVLFEMLTATRTFQGDDISTTLAAVLKEDPNWSALPAAVPVGVRRLLSRCLDKNPRERLRDIGEARIATEGALSSAVDRLPAMTVHEARWRPASALVATTLITVIVTAVVVWFITRSTIVAPHVWRFQIAPSATAALAINGLTHDLALTPDGTHVVYVGANGTTLFLRPLDQLEATPLVRGVAARDPFVSPDGQWVGFFDGPQTLKKVAITGGPAVLIARLDSFEHGAAWAADGTIIFATAGSNGLQRVSADGGVPSVLTKPDRERGEAEHMWPHLLPEGQGVLYTVRLATGGVEADAVAILDLRSGRRTILLQGGSDAQCALSGHLVYQTAGTLRAIGFDATRLLVAGPARTVVPQVLTTPLGAMDAALARDGTLVYVTGGAYGGTARTLVLVDRQGHETPVAAPPRAYAFPRFSPDGTRLAVTALDQNTDIWVWDIAHATLTRVTSDPAIDTSPEWTRDGRRVVFASNRAGALNLFSMASDGTGVVERLTESPNGQTPTAISPDGTRVLFSELSRKTGHDMMILTLDRTPQVRPLVQTPFDERNGVVSPDGHWLAYEGNDTGSYEIYVQPFPAIDRRWQVSTSGGTQPLWARTGRELFYIAADGALMRVNVGETPTWSTGPPTKVLEGRYVVSTGGNFPRNYDIAPGGGRFLVMKAATNEATTAPPQIVVIEHFDKDLERLVPAK